MGGKLESFYYAFGATDVFIIADLPDNASAASLNLAVTRHAPVPRIFFGSPFVGVTLPPKQQHWEGQLIAMNMEPADTPPRATRERPGA